MPLIYSDKTLGSEEWCQSECARVEHWYSRHAALFENNWVGKHLGTDYDLGTSRCDLLPGDTKLMPFHVGNRKSAELRLRAEQFRVEFEALNKKWQRDTKHLSLISKKITHPAYLRIMGMGEAAIPLLLEALRDKPAHWFAALRATTNIDPSPPEGNPSKSRDAWLDWGRSQGFIE